MNIHIRSNILCLMYCGSVLFSLSCALPSVFQPANSSDGSTFSLDRPTFLPDHLLQEIKNATSGRALRSSGCYKPTPTARHVSPQDATIALGDLARTREFYTIRTFSKSVVMQHQGTAVILLVKVGDGDDYFSVYDILMQAFNIINHCIFQQWTDQQLGGALEVGTGFRVVVRGRMTQSAEV